MEARVCCVSGKSGDIGKYRGNTYAIYHRSDGFLPSVILGADHQLMYNDGRTLDSKRKRKRRVPAVMVHAKVEEDHTRGKMRLLPL